MPGIVDGIDVDAPMAEREFGRDKDSGMWMSEDFDAPLHFEED